jgi:hypothetical protein
VSDAATESLLGAIREKRNTDPLIGAKVAGQELFGRIIVAMKNEKGVHSESLCSALGALAGYACQASLRAQSVAMTEVQAKDGKRFFFGDALNKLLAEDQYSVWSLAAGAAQQAGAAELPDLLSIFKHVSATVGSEAFGVPRMGASHGAADLPVQYVRALWPALLPILTKLCDDVKLWPLAYSFAIQHAIRSVESVLAPQVALSIVMESAIPMSKVDLG